MDEVSKLETNDPGSILTKASRVGGPVTCVSLPRPGCILWALGPYLQKNDDNDHGNSPAKLLVFPRGGSVHGISYVQNNNLFDSVVFGACQLSFCNVLSSATLERVEILVEGQQEPSQHMRTADWIWDIAIVEGNNDKNEDSILVIGLAHHKIDIWTVGSAKLPLKLSPRSRINGAPCVLLTSMHLFRNTDDSFSIAAGSAFHNIHVWSVGRKELDTVVTNDSISECLKGHAGVIHSVKFSSDGRSLASTSDDRSVRLWKIQESGQFAMQWAGWGHSARVWSVAFADSCLASVAEDGKVFLWCLVTGKALSTIQHSCPLWSIDISEDNNAIVGTCEGTVAIYDLDARMEGRGLQVSTEVAVPDDRPPPVDRSNCDIVPVSVTDDVKEGNPTTSKKKKRKAEKILAQVIVGLEWSREPDQEMGLLLATRAGSIMKFNMKSKQWIQLPPWWESGNMGPGHILATDGCCMTSRGHWAAIGTTRGHIVVVSLNSPRRFILSAPDLKSVQSLMWTNDTTMISFHVRAVAIWMFQSPAALGDLNQPASILQLSTKGVPLCCSYDKDSGRAVVGDSRGNISLFNFPATDATEEHSTRGVVHNAISSIPRVHQKEHITKIALLDDTIYSVGNDGNLHTCYVVGQSLQKGWSMPASTMTGISDMNLPEKSRVFVSGYYGNTYRMVDMATGYEFFKVDTGGRQRTHHFATESAPDSLNPSLMQMAVCMNNKDGSNKLSLHRAIKREGRHLVRLHEGISTHTETIFDACFFTLGSVEPKSFLLTGSEDCKSKISLWEHGECIESLSLTPQESCVRAVCVSQIDDTCALLVVGGGKLVLQFFLVSPKQRSGVINGLSDLRIQFRGHGVTKRNSTIDHRINSVKALPLEADSRTHIVVACDSDGNCHLFLVSETESRSGIPSGLFIPTSPRPLLCVELCRIKHRLIVLLGTTGGEVLVFDIPGVVADLVSGWDSIAENWKALTTFKGHQIGTNAICVSSPSNVRPLDNGKDEFNFTVYSGGDDQAICICEIHLDVGNGEGVELTREPDLGFARESSFSAIKGIFEYVRGDRHFIVTVGYSQQLAIWSAQQSEDKSSDLCLLDRIDVDLGDVNCLAAGKETNSMLHLAVCGLGIESFNLAV